MHASQSDAIQTPQWASRPPSPAVVEQIDIGTAHAKPFQKLQSLLRKQRPGAAAGTVFIVTDSVFRMFTRADSIIAAGSATHPPRLVNELARKVCRMHAGAMPSALVAPLTFRTESGPTVRDSISQTLYATRCAQSGRAQRE